MTTPVSHDWTRPEDRTWAHRLRLRLVAAHGAPAAVINRVLAEAQEASAETGAPAAELFGPPDAYAAEVARERIPVEVRAQVDLDGATVQDRWRALTLGTGGPGVVVCLIVLLREGWSVGLTPAALAVALAVLLGFVAAAWGFLERRAGELRRGWVSWAAAVGVVAAGAAVADRLRDAPQHWTLPVLVPLAACVGLLALSSHLPTHVRAEPDPRSLTPEQWFDRLAGLLRGRYYLGRAALAEQVGEAEAYWRESGAEHPHDEFGTPEVYALRLVEGSRGPRRARRRAEAWFYTTVALFWLWMTIGTITTDGVSSDSAWRIGGLALFALMAAFRWRRTDPGQV